MMFGDTLKPKFIDDLKTKTEIPAIRNCCGKEIVRKREEIWSNDERLQEDPSSVLGFFMLHNTAPPPHVSQCQRPPRRVKVTPNHD